MFMDTWVATDGITTVRFSDLQSAEIYCAQTGWQTSDLWCIRQQLIVTPDGESAIVEPWCNRMDPDVDTEVQGTWLDHVFVPPANSVANGTSEDDVPVTYSSEYLRQLGSISERLRWDFRDLAATEPTIYNNLVAYVKKCDAKGKKPTLKEAEKIVGRYAN